MKKYQAYLLYFLYWILFFVIAKIIFLLYYFRLTQTLNGSEILKVFLYGLRMDASFAGYICILPFILLLVKSFILNFQINKIIKIYTFTLIVILSFLVVADLGLYKAWRFRMDDTPLQYFKSPKEMMTTASSAPIFTLSLIFLLFIFVALFFYKKYFNPYLDKKQRHLHVADIFLSLFLIVILFIPIRGGIQKIPINISDVYFSEKIFADHAAINLPWNVMFSILNRHDAQNPFDYFPLEKSQKLVESLYDNANKNSSSILSVEKPNIVIIILESFTAKWVGCLGGVPGVTPQLDEIAADGLLFTNIYATGDRSEKGLIGILSGYPNQAITSIIKTPTKTRYLPSLNQTLKEYGYHSSYTYGGELEFANIKSYLINTGFDQLTDKYSFPISLRTTSWGVHDQYVLDEFSQHLKSEQTPFFSVLFTLSSHEPYDVPLQHFKEKDETSQFKNSIYYTDSVIGDFINKSKLTKWWPNTLVVLVADHGHPLPGNDANDVPSKFHIPLIFTGGALNTKGINTNIGSQTDIITTILNQMKISSSSFKWGKDLLDSSAKQFAFYCFNNGFGWVTPSGTETMDNVSKRPIYVDKNFDTSAIKYGKAYMQFSYQDFLKR